MEYVFILEIEDLVSDRWVDVVLRCSCGIDWYIRIDFGLIVYFGIVWFICYFYIDVVNDRIRIIEWIFDKFDWFDLKWFMFCCIDLYRFIWKLEYINVCMVNKNKIGVISILKFF